MKTKRAAGVLAVFVTVAVLPLMAASPASADQGSCQYYLHERGYKVGPKIESACRTGSDPANPGSWIQCYWGLTGIGVRSEDAAGACNAA
ncbi:hypothetical protein [Streptomyces sp. NPDC008265]|uniref:hypothetical protein n=1 Tax=Streptomyces sp. NPDC008265 TaxID=3364824 RepID=UPI0036E8A880